LMIFWKMRYMGLVLGIAKLVMNKIIIFLKSLQS
jgi:hypothetical protein